MSSPFKGSAASSSSSSSSHAPLPIQSAAELAVERFPRMATTVRICCPPPVLTALAQLQRRKRPLWPSDVGKLYELQSGTRRVRGFYHSRGRNGMHNFRPVGPQDEDDALLRVHYVNIVRELEPPTEVIVPPSMRRIRQCMYAFWDEYCDEVSHRSRGEDGQRLEIHVGDNATLMSQLKNRKKRKGSSAAGRKYIDPTYHETVQAVDAEWMAFCTFAATWNLTVDDMRFGYDLVLSLQAVSRDETGVITVTGPCPLTAMLPVLLPVYQAMHYTTVLQVADWTSSNRLYEQEFTRRVLTLPFSQWRPFVLPEATTDREISLVDAIGGILDVQTPTSGPTIGAGTVNKVVYKHFQRTMEIVNGSLDAAAGPYSNAGFLARTQSIADCLDRYAFAGLYSNEEVHLADSGYADWDSLQTVLHGVICNVYRSILAVPEDDDGRPELIGGISLDALEGTERQKVKQVELIGATLGVLVKKEKRLILSHALLGNKKGQERALENLYKLSRVEASINRQAEALRALRIEGVQQQQSRMIAKELDDLKRS